MLGKRNEKKKTEKRVMVILVRLNARVRVLFLQSIGLFRNRGSLRALRDFASSTWIHDHGKTERERKVTLHVEPGVICIIL